MKSLLLWDGLETKEEYDSVINGLQEQNRKNLLVYNVIIAIIFAILTIVSYFVEDISANRLEYIATIVSAVLLAVILKTIAKGKSYINVALTYVFLTMMGAFTIIVGTINEPNEPAVGFNIFLVLIPFLTYDVAIRSLAYRILICGIYFVCVFKFKNHSVVWTDVTDAIAYGTLGALVGLFNQKIKTRAYYLGNNMQKEIDKKTAQMEVLSEKTVSALAYTIDSKDRYTSGHSHRVANYSLELAKRMGKSEEEQRNIYYAGLLHDVGKIRVPGAVINKPGKLTEEEFEQIKIHPVSGYHTLRDIYDDKLVALGAKYHHERYDGTGYPNNLAGENIPEIARIIGVADAYDAMASNRSYRDALPQEVVRSEIEKGRGKQFDPSIADIMLQMIDEDVNYEMCEKEVVNKDVLVIDDEIINIKIVSFILKDEAVNVYSAQSGEEGLAILKERPMDLVLLDIAMPGMDGFEVYSKLREISDAPVVFMTADKNLESIKKSAELGIADYVTKPFLPMLLKETVHGIVNRWR